MAAYIETIQACETAIGRVRAAIRAGISSTPEVGADFAFIRDAITPRLLGFARRAGWMAPTAAEEALEAMYDRLLDDIWSLSFVSLETQFGAYLRSMPIRVLQQIRRKHVPDAVSLPVDRLDDPMGDDGQMLHEVVPDQRAADAFVAIGEREALNAAIARLPADERLVIALRLQEVENRTIAQQLGVSAPTATRIYGRALAALRHLLDAGEDDQ